MAGKHPLESSNDPPPFTPKPHFGSSSTDPFASSSMVDDYFFLLDSDFGDFVEENPSLTLVGKVLGNRPYCRQAVFEALPLAWNAFFGIEIWVQLHDLPLEAMHRSIAPRLISKIGLPSEIMVIDSLSQGEKIQFLRARVTLEVAAPLRYFFTIQSHSGQECRVSINYFEVDQSHRVIHGCNPLSPCPLLPPRVFDSETRGMVPIARMLETAKFIDFSSSDSEGTSPIPVSVAYLTACSSDGAPSTLCISLPLTLTIDDCHMALPHVATS
ncbi:hypothetical protein NE237_016275 [Protea cynaroides]|uniref:DUF4283 domain-containing protein n=1 Tax=Protea cynaroides TaxID=273540 RepID=A0A9Q0KFM7_9MAGN|nr:hypothetical protein NE237_016275 [Protea cynaroides]